MAKFRKRPVEVEAVQLTEDADWEQIAKWCGGKLSNMELANTGEYETLLYMQTLEAKKHIACEGDWVIQGVRGEFYSCKPDIFEATYEPVEDEVVPFRLCERGIEMFRVNPDFSIWINPALEMNDAAKMFWDAVVNVSKQIQPTNT